MSIKQSYEKKLQAQLDEWNSQIEQLKAKAEQAEADLQLDYYKQIEEMRSLQQIANQKLNQLRDSGDDAWEDLKAGVESAWDTLGHSVKSAVSRFK